MMMRFFVTSETLSRNSILILFILYLRAYYFTKILFFLVLSYLSTARGPPLPYSSRPLQSAEVLLVELIDHTHLL